MTKVCEKHYVDKEGNEFANLPADPSKIIGRQFKFSDGTVRVLKPTDFPKAIQWGAALTGLGYVGSASLNSAGGDVEEAIKALDARIATMMDGAWSAIRTGGGGAKGQDSLIVAAVLAAAADSGEEVDADKVRAYFLGGGVKGGDDAVRKARSERRALYLKRPDVQTHYARINAERQAAKAAKAAEQSKGAAPEDAPTFDF